MIEAILMGGGMGFSIKSIQTIYNPSITSSNIIDITINTIDPDKAFVIWQQSGTSNDGEALSTCDILDSNTVRVKRNNTSFARYSIQVIELSGKVMVQRGEVSLTSGTSIDVTLGTTVDPAKSISLCTSRPASTADWDLQRFLVASSLQDGDTLRLSRNSSIGGSYIQWQVVEFS